MNKIFNETSFLASVVRMNEILPNVKDDKTAKNFMRTVIVNGDFGKRETFTYLVSLISAHRPELINRRFDVQGWRKIYAMFINSPMYPKFGKALESKMTLLETEYEYKVCFTEHARLYGLDPESLLNEIKLDCIGWNRINATLRTVAVKKGIAPHPAEGIITEGHTEKAEDKTPATSMEPMVKEEASTESVAKKSITKAEKSTDTSKKETVSIGKKTKSSKKSAKATTDKTKRSYNNPVLQYARKQVFDSVETASANTGIPVCEIISSIENKPAAKVDTIWKYAGNAKTKVIQFTLLHTYKNQNDINKSSQDVCGKRIFHNNVVPKLKEWKQTSREEYVWIQIEDACRDTKESKVYVKAA